MSQRHASDSKEQQLAEAQVLTGLNAQLQISMKPGRVDLSEEGGYVAVDGIDRANRTICEVYCRIGPLTPAQAHKVSSDILKLTLAAQSLGGTWRKLIAFIDRQALASVSGRSWRSLAAKQHGVEFLVVNLPADTLEGILAAQTRQIMVNPVVGADA
jgi:hypothetical protein